ncbi:MULTISPECIES: 2-oxoglutarate and iron-dependent oxygenase domain-containing protein [Kitasatospora]|uniref:Putative oxidoreductase n=1 Tax=Kitasatospora setae (strain ATCC 33774 / DSM 43861 / JCM 3304 / KCC A-0304 / NBRC 14216 / KM-6054) TaxID=452652 RepID=E4N0K6_KITSK|nr:MULTISPECIES: 2-oxoglutarate and iron-dependent oxygenase domain-containing protein [Kitasatospora]BAJ31690.1 putative oxidoreductase [Kitasatospora setae KM-6054]
MLREIDLRAPGDHAHLRAALRDGFFLVRNTVPDGLLDEAYGLLGDFFRLPAEQKAACQVPGSNGQSGYLPPLVETAEKGAAPDWKELFHWGAALPAAHPLRERYPARYREPYFPDHLVPGIGKALTELHTRMREFQLDVVRVLAEPLGVHPDYFTEMLEDGPVVNRATWYPPMDLAPTGQHVWAVEHQDFDLITALPRATAAGLEVLVDGEWLAVDVPEGHAVVNVGMVLDRLTGGLARAAVHRVVAAPGQRGGRLSIVQFCHPTPWTVLTPLAVAGAEGRPQRYPTLTAGDLFQRTMYRINRLDTQRAPAARP